jgi:hypothetical protein
VVNLPTVRLPYILHHLRKHVSCRGCPRCRHSLLRRRTAFQPLRPLDVQASSHPLRSSSGALFRLHLPHVLLASRHRFRGPLRGSAVPPRHGHHLPLEALGRPFYSLDCDLNCMPGLGVVPAALQLSTVCMYVCCCPTSIYSGTKPRAEHEYLSTDATPRGSIIPTPKFVSFSPHINPYQRHTKTKTKT